MPPISIKPPQPNLLIPPLLSDTDPRNFGPVRDMEIDGCYSKLHLFVWTSFLMNAMYVVFLWGESMNSWNYHCLFATPSLDQKKNMFAVTRPTLLKSTDPKPFFV